MWVNWANSYQLVFNRKTSFTSTSKCVLKTNKNGGKISIQMSYNAATSKIKKLNLFCIYFHLLQYNWHLQNIADYNPCIPVYESVVFTVLLYSLLACHVFYSCIYVYISEDLHGCSLYCKILGYLITITDVWECLLVNTKIIETISC